MGVDWIGLGCDGGWDGEWDWSGLGCLFDLIELIELFDLFVCLIVFD